MVRLAGRPLLALDLETTGLDPHSDQVVLVSVGDDSEQLLVDCRKVSLEPLVPLLQGPVVKVTHNGAFDLAMLRSLGVYTENVLDTMLIEQVLQNGRATGSRSLAALSERYLGVTLDKTERLGFARTFGDFSPAQLEYARRDILATYQVLLEQVFRLSAAGLADTARVECEAVPAFADLHYDGVFLDKEAWSGLIDEAREERDRARGEIDKHLKKVASADLFGRVDVNLGSDAELKTVLSSLLKKRVQDVNKTALRHMDHPVGEVLLNYREMNKLVSAYGETFLETIHPKTGRIHADFQQIGAPTGRVACARPNLQNIPRGSRFRRCFCAPRGCRMVTADYSGCELRILAEMSEDPAFINTFQRGGDLHAIVASEIFSTPVAKDRNPELRDRAKAINFGLAYGMGPGGLATVTGVSLSEAERLLKRYFQAYPQVKQYLDRSARTAVERGFAETLGGRKLFLQIGERMEGPDLAAVTRVAKNMPIQGTNADMLKVAMAGVRRRLLDGGMDARMVNCVHDEILIEAEEGEAWDVAEVVREEMVKAGERYVKKVPIVVDVSVGDSWLK
jgi:DNA polymerase-1